MLKARMRSISPATKTLENPPNANCVSVLPENGVPTIQMARVRLLSPDVMPDVLAPVPDRVQLVERKTTVNSDSFPVINQPVWRRRIVAPCEGPEGRNRAAGGRIRHYANHMQDVVLAPGDPVHILFMPAKTVCTAERERKLKRLVKDGELVVTFAQASALIGVRCGRRSIEHRLLGNNTRH
jgi:hypothetical protein